MRGAGLTQGIERHNITSVKLRCIPPMGHRIFISGNGAGRRLYPVLHRCPGNTHSVIGETRVLRQCNMDLVVVWTCRMIEPVVDLELYPCRSKQIQSLGSLEVFSSHQTFADYMWVRVQKTELVTVGCNRVQGDVSSERRLGRSHSRHVRFGERAVRSAGITIGRYVVRNWNRLMSIGRVEQVFMTEPVPHQLERQNAQVCQAE